MLRLTSPHAHANSSKAYCESWLTRLSVDPDMDEFFYDLAAVYRAEIAALADAGCIYLQLDDTNLAYLCSEEMRKDAQERGEDVQKLPRQYVELINASLRDKPVDMTVAIHLCRYGLHPGLSNHITSKLAGLGKPF